MCSDRKPTADAILNTMSLARRYGISSFATHRPLSATVFMVLYFKVRLVCIVYSISVFILLKHNFVFEGKISFLEFSEAMDKAREAQDGPAKGESEDTSGAGNTESPVETPMEVSDTAKEGSDKPSSKSKLKFIFLYYMCHFQ